MNLFVQISIFQGHKQCNLNFEYSYATHKLILKSINSKKFSKKGRKSGAHNSIKRNYIIYHTFLPRSNSTKLTQAKAFRTLRYYI